METTARNIQFSEESLREVERIISQFPEKRQKSAILRILHMAQEQFDHWLSPEVMDYVAGLLDIKPIEVYEVASFYSMYHLKPVGKVVLEVCRTGPCSLRGADKVVNYLENKLQVKDGETTGDGMFTLKTVECLGACGYAPMMQVGEHYHEHLTEEKLDELLTEFRNNRK